MASLNEAPILNQVPVSPASTERFRVLLGERYAEVESAIADAGNVLAGRVVWHVNSTARGGGVAEMLQSLLAYASGAGVDVRWLTIAGNPEFFRLTKRIHNRLHGADGDGGELGVEERAVYEAALAEPGEALASIVSDGDVVYLHDPQTVGLVRALESLPVHVVWRCHIGVDQPNLVTRQAWEFLRPYVEPTDAQIFSRRAYVWDGLDDERVWIVAPSIDAFSAKNQPLEEGVVAAILGRAGLAQETGAGLAQEDGVAPAFTRQDGSSGSVERMAELDQDAPVPVDAPLVVQVSRWDGLKDHSGVMRAFCEHLRDTSSHLLLAGPSVAEVVDDPEGAEVLAELRSERDRLPDELRSRVHIACIPMVDVEENAAIINALQRRATVVVQKSLAEGFGLTVAEAMWKARPMVASRVGGIQDQIVDGETGVLIEDPTDLEATARGIDRLLADPALALEIGTAGRESVRSSFLGTRHLVEYMRLLKQLIAGA